MTLDSVDGKKGRDSACETIGDGEQRERSERVLVSREDAGSVVEESSDLLYGSHAELADSLRESEARFRSFVDVTADGIVFHEGGRILDANSRFLEMTGYTHEEVVGLGILDVVAPEDRARVARHVEARTSEPYEVVGQRKDGARVPLLVRARDLEYQGAPARVVWVRDLSEAKRVLGALQHSEDRYRQLFETCPEGIYVSDMTRRFVAVNPAMVELFGYPSEDALRAIDPYSLYAEAAERESFLERLFAEGSVRDFASVQVTRGGRLLEIRETANLVYDEAGDLVGYQGILRDVTEQRRLERQLVQSQKMEAVGRLAGGVAHDFNNLLTAIAGFSDLALEALAPDEPAAADLREIQLAAAKATRLTEQLLGFSRKQVQEPRRVDLNQIIAGFQQFLQRTLGTDVEVVLDLESSLGAVMADPGQVEQVLMNLAINSRAAMPTGGRLTLSSRNREVGPLEEIQGVSLVPGKYSVLTVVDDGTGMSEETLSRAFEPFFTTKEETKGTGLGLATVYGIVKQSAGYVWIESALGTGTTFSVYWPQADDGGGDPDDAPVAAIAAQQVVPSATDGKLPRTGETLLLVEDDFGVRELARRCLEAAGYEVLVAADASEARELWRAEGQRIQLMLTDIVMPNGNGVELASEIRTERPGMPILLMSGFPDRALSHDHEAVRAFPLLAKPFSAGEITARVRELIDAG